MKRNTKHFILEVEWENAHQIKIKSVTYLVLPNKTIKLCPNAKKIVSLQANIRSAKQAYSSVWYSVEEQTLMVFPFILSELVE